MATSKHYTANGGYPDNWKEISRHRREDIAHGQCEWIDEHGERCTRRHMEPIPGNVKGSKTILTTAHLDNNPTNCDTENLRALCQRHHLTLDAKMHAKRAKMTKRDGELAHYNETLF